MKKLSFSLILSILLLVSPALTVHAEGDWIPNWKGETIPDAYYYKGCYWTEPPSTPGATYYYNGQKYTVGGSTTSTSVQPSQPQAQAVQPPPPAPQPYYYDNAWHQNIPTEGSKSYWYNGAWYTTPATQPAPTPTQQKPSLYVDNTATAKAQSLVAFAYANGVNGSFSDTTDSTTQAQKYLSFYGLHGGTDMTLTTSVGMDGNYVTKYWKAGREITELDAQNLILACR